MNLEVSFPWKTRPLSELILESRSGISLSEEDFAENGHPVVHKGDVRLGGIVDLSKRDSRYVKSESFLANARAQVDNSYLVVSLRDLVPSAPQLGLINTLPDGEVALLAQGTYGFRVNPELLNPRFLTQLSSVEFFRRSMRTNAMGSTQKHLRSSEFFELEVPTPPINEQKKIAEILSTWDRAIELGNLQINNLNKLKSGLLQKLFSEEYNANYQFTDLRDIAQIRRGASPRPINNPDFFADKGRAWVRIADVTQQRKYLQYASQYLSALGESKSVAVDPGQLIMSICATIGVPMIVKIPACVHDGFVLITGFEKSLDPEYLYYALSSLTAKLATGGQPGTQRNLNTTIVGSIVLPLPPKEFQAKVVAVLSSFDRVIEDSQTKNDAFSSMKSGLMQKLLTGKIRVKV